MNLFSFYIPEWVFVGINLLILVVVLRKVLWSRVIKVIDERQQAAEQAAQYAVKAREGYDELEARRAMSEKEFQENLAAQLSDARRRAGAEYDRIVGEAEAKAKLIVSAAHTQGEKMRESQLNDARNEIISAVLGMTGELLEAEMDAEKNERIVASFLERKEGVR